MADPQRPLLDQLRQEVIGLGGELRQMAALRWQLARLEVEADLRHVQRLALGLAVSGTMGVAAVALACVALADVMETSLGGSFAGWLAVFATALLVGAALVAWLAWRAFRRRFIGLQESLEELREDAVWIGEWMRDEESG
jgi:hypothetical protein